MADIHLQVRPGTDAWCLAALGACWSRRTWSTTTSSTAHTGAEPVLAAYREVDVADYAERCGVPEELIRTTARRIGTAASVCTYEDLGIQQAPHSTLNSYLNKMLWILTGNFAKQGGMFLHSTFAPIAGAAPAAGTRARSRPPSGCRAAAGRRGRRRRRCRDPAAGVPARRDRDPARQPAPRTGERRRQRPGRTGRAAARPRRRAAYAGHGRPHHRRAGAVQLDRRGVPDRPPRPVPGAVARQHEPGPLPGRLGVVPEAMRAVDLSVVIDIAMTETARLADYVLPASSQFEKWECTFFNVDFPKNVFHLRRPSMEPLTGHPARAGDLRAPDPRARCGRRLRPRSPAPGRPQGAHPVRDRLLRRCRANPRLMGLAGYVLLRDARPHLPEGARGTASLWGVSQLCTMANPAASARAGFTGAGFEPGNALRADPDRRGGHLHGGRLRRCLELHPPTRPALHPRGARAARAPAGTEGRRRAPGPPRSSRSSSPPASGAPSRRTRSSVTPPGAAATPRGRSASARTTPRRTASRRATRCGRDREGHGGGGGRGDRPDAGRPPLAAQRLGSSTLTARPASHPTSSRRCTTRTSSPGRHGTSTCPPAWSRSMSARDAMIDSADHALPRARGRRHLPARRRGPQGHRAGRSTTTSPAARPSSPAPRR
jgi:hypothetical protein